MPLQIEQLPALEDNYIYLLTCSETGATAVVDPAEAGPVMAALGDKNLDFILNTHHHPDHVGGNLELKEKYGCTVISSRVDAERGVIPGVDKALEDGDHFTLGRCVAEVMALPGHTHGHIAYWFEEDAALFCGDVLFGAGCGKLFEGEPEEMYVSLWKIKSLPPETRIYCAHEYTEENLYFCLQENPDDPAYNARMAKVQKMRAAGIPTVPSTLAEELESNIFLRAEDLAEFARVRRLRG